MRLFVSVAAACLVLFAAVSSAEARTRGSKAEELLYVAPTKITGPSGENLALCHLVETSGVFFVNLFRRSISYALASNNCLTDSYIPLTQDMLTAAKASGEIPADTPSLPTMTFAQKAEGSWGWAAFAAFCSFW